MSKISELAKRFQIKLAQMAVPQAPDLTPQQVRAKQEEMKLQDAGEKVITSLVEAVGLPHNQGIKFTELKFLTDTAGKAVSWRMSVSPQIADQFRAGVMNLKKTTPSFSISNYIGQLFVQIMPGVRILSAQPIAIG